MVFDEIESWIALHGGVHILFYFIFLETTKNFIDFIVLTWFS
jgi:hypothetical protein